MKYGLIGKSLGHSFSKLIHDKIGLYDYEIKEIAEEDLHSFMMKKDFCAINVTIPYKQSVIPYLDYTDTIAEKIGAVNTIINKDGKLYGYNTDHIGLTKLVQHIYPDVQNKKCIISGTGGTSKTAYAVLKELGASEIVILGRNGKGDADYSQTEKYADGAFLLNTTSVGMFPNNNSCPVDINVFKNLRGVVDVVYNPLRTNLICDAQEKNIPAEGGLYMLVSQAVATAEYFTGKKADSSLTDKIFSELYFEMKNIILIGMPSSGKSTIGKELAKLTKKDFFDTDEMIEKKEKMTVRDYFAKFGEQAFREKETELIRSEILNLHGAVIATGGGMILKAENIRMLKENGILVFIDRPLSSLIVTDSRPLSATFPALENLYKSRYSVYESSADIHVKISDDLDKSIKSVLEAVK